MTLQDYYNLSIEERAALPEETKKAIKDADKQNYMKHLRETGRIKPQNNR